MPSDKRYPRRLGVPHAEELTHILLKCTLEEKTKFKMAAAEQNMSYIQLVMFMLEKRERDIERAKRLQGSPLHRAGTSSDVEARA